MGENVRISREISDGGGRKNSIVEQTTDIINRFRLSIVRTRKERLLDEDLQATENIVNQLDLTQLISKETLGKLIFQGDSIGKSYNLINLLNQQIKDIAQDLNEVNGKKFCSNGKCFPFKSFSCLTKKKKNNQRRKISNHLNQIEQSFHPSNQNRLSLITEREEILAKTRSLSKDRRQHPQFVELMNKINDIQRTDMENKEKKLNKYRDYLLQNHSLAYGYIDQPERLITEMNMAIYFNQINNSLDHLLETTNTMTNEMNQHNIIISKIESQAMESGNLLTDYTLLGHHILGSSTTQFQTINYPNTIPTNFNTLAMTTGQNLLLNSVI